MRLLDVVRLSRDTDESTSPERQHESNHYMARARGDRIVASIEDLDVSGSVSPFERPNLGPWLTGPAKIEQWDGIVVAKIDRLTRSLYDFADLVRWCNVQGKTLISVTESIDLSTAHGKMIANILVAFADFERERTGERRREAAEKLRQVGRWGGGRAPYGYMMKEGGAGVLYQNPDTAPVVRRIVNSFVDGMNAAAICQMLNDEGVSPPRSAPRWEVPSVWRLVRSRYLRGELQYRGKTVLDSDGNPVMLTEEPLITESEWNLLVQALQRLSRPHRGERETNHLLLRVAYCGECDRPLYYQRAHPQDEDHYYRCTGRHGMRMIRSSVLEGVVEGELLAQYGQDKIMRRVAVGKDYASELATTERSLADLEEQFLGNNLTAARFASAATRLEARITELRTLAQNAAEERWEPTGETVADRWQRSDTAGRRNMLLRLGIRWNVYREYRIKDHASRWRFETGWLPVEESHERLAHEAASQ
jgi:DNA invertase Pin-like site-specific DNA recombinase